MQAVDRRAVAARADWFAARHSRVAGGLGADGWMACRIRRVAAPGPAVGPAATTMRARRRRRAPGLPGAGWASRARRSASRRARRGVCAGGLPGRTGRPARRLRSTTWPAIAGRAGRILPRGAGTIPPRSRWMGRSTWSGATQPGRGGLLWGTTRLATAGSGAPHCPRPVAHSGGRARRTMYALGGDRGRRLATRPLTIRPRTPGSRPPMGHPRDHLAGGVVNGRIYVAGGGTAATSR